MSSMCCIRVAALVAVFAAGSAAHAQCEWVWADGFQVGGHGLAGRVCALLSFDDGSGPALYAGGTFRTAGEFDADCVARWDGQNWTALGEGTSDEVWTLAAFDDGTGPALDAGGKFTHASGQSAYRVAKWNGSAWSPVCGGIEHGYVHALAVFDDGTGPALYAGVSFFAASMASATGVMKWDGSTWSPVGGGLNGAAHALAVFDDGRGPALYAGGWFLTASGATVNHIARWDGVAWSALGGGMDDAVDALAVFEDDAGPALYAAGRFTTAGGTMASGVARWDGSSWSALGGGMGGTDVRVYALAVYDDGRGPALFAGGNFMSAGPHAAANIACWDGTAWSPLGAGVDGPVYSVTVFESGRGSMLGAGGAFATAGGLYASNAASWDGAAWSPLVTPRGNGMNGGVFALTVYDDGRGPALYAAGYFSRAGQVDANLVAKWDGSSWSPLGSGLSGGTAANTLTVFDDGSGPALYVGGRFTTAGGFTVNNIAKWDGAAWSALSTGVNLDVYALAVVDLGSGPALYAGGAFMTAGGVTVNRVARWDGTSWSALGSGFNHSVYALAGYDNGDGPGLFAGGEFTRSGGLYVNYIARWDGTAWNQLQREFDGSVLALRVMDDGVQTALYAGGTFENSAFFVLHHVGRYVGRTDNYYWRPLGDGVEPGSSNRVRALAEFNAGASPVVAAGGYFDTAGGGPAPNIALWNGTNWSPLGSGVNTNVYALAAWDDGSGPALWAGGVFHTAGGKPSDRIAKWTCVSGAVRAAQGCPSSRTLADHSELSALAPQPRARAADDRAAPVWPGLRADDRRAAPDPHVAQDMAAREDMCAGAIWSTTDDLDDWDWALASQVDVEHSSADDFWFEGEPAGYTFVGAVHWQSHYWNGPYVAPDRGSISIMMDVDGAPSYELRYYYFSDSNLLIVPVNDESVQCQVVLRRAFRADNNVRYWISINVDADYPPAWGPVCHVADPPLGHPVHWVGPDWDSAWTPFYDPAGDTLDLNFCLLPGQPWICEVLGDVNGDGVCNNFDITPFVFALTHGEADFAVRYPGGHYWCADCNQDGAVNNFDITPFVHVLIGQ